MSSRALPFRGAVWFANLDPALGHEQAGRRPILIVSADTHNVSRADMVIAVPLTKTLRLHPFRVRVEPPEGRLRVASDILCDQIRAISHRRLLHPIGGIAPATLEQVERVLRSLLLL